VKKPEEAPHQKQESSGPPWTLQLALLAILSFPTALAVIFSSSQEHPESIHQGQYNVS